MKLSLLILIVIITASCVPGDDFEVPEALKTEVEVLEPNSDLDAVLGAYFQSSEEVEVVTFEEELILEAYVVSSDESGNFYKELILQDAPENPKAGVAVQLNLASYYETFDFGRKIYVNLKGLSLGELNGVAALGIANGKLIEQIPLSQVQKHLIRTQDTAQILPLNIRAIDFTDRTENLYVRIENVQFSNFFVGGDTPYTFASEDNDEFDGERELVSCNGDFPFILSTSTFADFKSMRLPPGSGSVQGILTRDFYDEFFTIYLNSPQDLDLSEPTRCDPLSLDCGLSQSAGAKILFREDFETQKNNSEISGNGWTNFIQEGSVAWEGFKASGANASLGVSARVQTPGSGDHRTVSWLITPPIEFGRQTNEVLKFKTSTSFANSSLLEVLISNDWNGDPAAITTATWKVLPSAYIARTTDYFGDWISSGNVSLACAEGKAYIAFRYTGSDQAYYNGIYELDEVEIRSN